MHKSTLQSSTLHLLQLRQRWQGPSLTPSVAPSLVFSNLEMYFLRDWSVCKEQQRAEATSESPEEQRQTSAAAEDFFEKNKIK